MQAEKHETKATLFEQLPGLYIHPGRTREWLPELTAESGSALLKCRRLTPRLSSIITQHYKLAALEEEDGLDLAIAMLSFDALAQASHLAGAIFHAREIRMLISKPAIASLFAGAGEWAHGFAMANADLAPPASAQDSEDEPPTAEILTRDGQLCFRAWLNTLSAPAAQRVVLKFPGDLETSPLPPVFEVHGPAIFRAAGGGVLDHAH
jgi:hypothetical protein